MEEDSQELEATLSEVTDRISFGCITDITFGSKESELMLAFDITEHIYSDSVKALGHQGSPIFMPCKGNSEGFETILSGCGRGHVGQS